MTLWEDFIRIPKHEENEQYICVMAGREEFRMVSPIYRQNIFVGSMDDEPSNTTPLDFFDSQHTSYFRTKNVNFLDAILEAGDCMYVPAYYYLQSKTLATAENDLEKCSGVRCDGYRGFQNKTKSGYDCQEWKQQTPQKHDVKVNKKTYENAGVRGEGNNYCRNPDTADGRGDSDTIWCYTTSEYKRWEECKPIKSASEVSPQSLIITHQYESHSKMVDMVFDGIDDNDWMKQEKMGVDSILNSYLGDIF